jgi:hypothetical protein
LPFKNVIVAAGNPSYNLNFPPEIININHKIRYISFQKIKINKYKQFKTKNKKIKLGKVLVQKSRER